MVIIYAYFTVSDTIPLVDKIPYFLTVTVLVIVNT